MGNFHFNTFKYSKAGLTEHEVVVRICTVVYNTRYRHDPIVYTIYTCQEYKLKCTRTLLRISSESATILCDRYLFIHFQI